ncbi:hypothetical protein Sjap_023843 [Stephania japonica]|uniref:Uncharacterized protein n=1 Tax=Stephania japonica TaxID=461633 RepID=A0AAP0ECC5_9MAGN
MEAIKDQSAGSASAGKSKLRYPLRSASKPKEDALSASAPKRGRNTPSVSKSESVLDFSGKEKSAKPPRRLSIPAKSANSPIPKPNTTFTPISEVRGKKSANGQGRSGTPNSDVLKSINLRKFSVLSSASYWLSQIKLSESAAKHSVSLGFFKLALESGCEPQQRMKDELKSYARRHNLVELGEPAKELLASYNIIEDLEQLAVSETCSHVPEEGTRSSDEDVKSTSSTGARKLKPKSLNTEGFEASAESTKEVSQKKNHGGNRASSTRNSKNSKLAQVTGGSNNQKKSPRPTRHEASKEKPMTRSNLKKSSTESDPVASLPDEELQEDKENMDAQEMEQTNVTEVV